MPKPLKIVLKILAVPVIFFAVTFPIYFFNLDMKMTSKLEPFLLKHYDNHPRDAHL